MANEGVETLTEERTETKLDPPWHVLVHDDPVTLMSYVTRVLKQVFGYDTAKARRLMMTVHTKGRAIVWTGERERAETYVAQLHAHQLLSTMERSSR